MHSQAVRDGVLRKVPAAELTLGDVVKLGAGYRVPADCRVLASDGLKVDNSSFTGEWLEEEVDGGMGINRGGWLQSH